MGKFKSIVLTMLTILPIVGLVGASNLSTAIIILGIGAVMIFTASPEISAIFLDDCRWSGIYDDLPCIGELQAGTDRNLEKSGEIQKKVIRPCRVYAIEAEAYLARTGEQCPEAGVSS